MAAAIALGSGLLLAILVGAGRGNAGVAFVIGGLVAFLVALPVLATRRR